MIIKKTGIFLLLFFFLFSTNVWADDISQDETDSTQYYFHDTYETTTQASNEPVTYAKHIVAIDRKTLSVLYEKDANTSVPMASTTKIMTCILALENASLTDIVTTSKTAAHVSGSTLGLKENMQLSMKDLLYGLMLCSRE